MTDKLKMPEGAELAAMNADLGVPAWELPWWRRIGIGFEVEYQIRLDRYWKDSLFKIEGSMGGHKRHLMFWPHGGIRLLGLRLGAGCFYAYRKPRGEVGQKQVQQFNAMRAEWVVKRALAKTTARANGLLS